MEIKEIFGNIEEKNIEDLAKGLEKKANNYYQSAIGPICGILEKVNNVKVGDEEKISWYLSHLISNFYEKFDKITTNDVKELLDNTNLTKEIKEKILIFFEENHLKIQNNSFGLKLLIHVPLKTSHLEYKWYAFEKTNRLPYVKQEILGGTYKDGFDLPTITGIEYDKEKSKINIYSIVFGPKSQEDIRFSIAPFVSFSSLLNDNIGKIKSNAKKQHLEALGEDKGEINELESPEELIRKIFNLKNIEEEDFSTYIRKTLIVGGKIVLNNISKYIKPIKISKSNEDIVLELLDTDGGARGLDIERNNEVSSVVLELYKPRVKVSTSTYSKKSCYTNNSDSGKFSGTNFLRGLSYSSFEVNSSSSYELPGHMEKELSLEQYLNQLKYQYLSYKQQLGVLKNKLEEYKKNNQSLLENVVETIKDLLNLSRDEVEVGNDVDNVLKKIEEKIKNINDTLSSLEEQIKFLSLVDELKIEVRFLFVPVDIN